MLAIEREGTTAVRRYSEQLDDWDPESFVVSEEEILRAEDSVDEELKRYINFAQEQVRNFAQLQRETLVDLEDLKTASCGDDVQPTAVFAG